MGNSFLTHVFAGAMCLFVADSLLAQAETQNTPRPNIILICIDDLGYADVPPFGQPPYPTPNIDRLVKEGRAFTDFSVSSAVCSASRAALMTGCYHMRVGISGALGPNARIGLSPEETTVAEICRSRGYATACIGKWHLGQQPEFMPLRQGFDEYFGLPYSNDMWPHHPNLAKLPAEAAARKSGYPPLPLIEGDEVIDTEITAEDQTLLTTKYTARAVDFVRSHRDQPFFLYLAHSMVHVPLFVAPENLDQSGHGLFADVMSEVDASLGKILDTLRELGLSEKTLIIFTSDNGPWLSYGNHAGSASPLREGKGTSFEGGVRVPTIMSWPGRIPAGTKCDEFAASIDLLPTIAKLIGADLPNHPIDGLDISELLFSTTPVESPHSSYLIYFASGELQAVRDRRWKLIFPHQYQTLGGQPGGTGGSPTAYERAEIELSLFDLKNDVGETRNVIDDHPEIVGRLQASADDGRRMFGDELLKISGNEIRGPGKLD